MRFPKKTARFGIFLRKTKYVLAFLLVSAVLGITLVYVVSSGVADVTSPYILSASETDSLPAGMRFDCVLILGAGLRPDGTPNDMLADRIRIACSVYLSDSERFGKVLLSGDHTGDYNEVAAMRTAAIALGVREDQLIEDHEGFSTFESVSRAQRVYGAHSILIVTQEYHLSRAVYIARTLGMEAYGVSADTRPYAHRLRRETREALARFKDYFIAGREKGKGEGL